MSSSNAFYLKTAFALDMLWTRSAGGAAKVSMTPRRGGAT